MKELKLDYEEFNRFSAAGKTTQQRLFTAEDSHKDKTQHARENVIHEAGLFQSRLGWEKAIILLEDGCEEFSNIVGLTQVRFAKGKIEKKFKEVRRVLAREGLIRT